MICDVWSR